MFFNISKDILGIGPTDGVTYQVTSFGRRPSRLGGVAGESLEKCVDLSPGEPFEALHLRGPGLITRIWITQPRPLNLRALRNVTVKMYWDDEEEPSVQAPLGDLFGATFARPVDYTSAYTAISSGAYLSFFPMPFRKRARVVLENEGPIKVRLIFFQFTYLKLDRDLSEDTPYFHCQWHSERLERGAPPFSVLDASGRGLYMGCHMNMQGAGYPWRPNPFNWFMPEGWGMGMLEGWERIWIDGAAADRPNVHGTGGEDYFNGAWYFTRVPSTSPTHGVTKRDYLTRRVSCYRFHVEMPVAFDDRIKVTIDHGLNNRLPAVFDCTSYWYQKEPHRPLEELPDASRRRRSGAVAGFAAMAAPVFYCGAGVAIARGLMRLKDRR